MHSALVEMPPGISFLTVFLFLGLVGSGFILNCEVYQVDGTSNGTSKKNPNKASPQQATGYLDYLYLVFVAASGGEFNPK